MVERNRTTLAVLGPQPWSQRAMLTSNDYKELAARCTELASEFSEPAVAEALRALASDYLARAAKLHHQTRRLSSWRPSVVTMAATNKCLA